MFSLEMADSFENRELHPWTCKGEAQDLKRMSQMLTVDPESLNRRHAQQSSDTENQEELTMWTTALMKAVMNKHFDCVKFLLNAGANMENEDYTLDSLICAIQSHSYNILELLLKHGLGPDFTRTGVNYESRSTYISLAAYLEATKELQLLLDYGGTTEDFAYIESSDNYHDVTPATWATCNVRSESLKVLLLNGAIVNFKIDCTPLFYLDPLKFDALSLPMHFVISYGNDLQEKFKMLNILYQFGADFSQRNSMGLTPLNVLENEDFVALVREHMRIVNTDLLDMSVVERRLIADKLHELTSTPMRLKGLCRLAIREAMGRGFLRNLSKLPDMPRELFSYLRFDTDS